jgi:nucleoside-diphosphate-sugar epimerase
MAGGEESKAAEARETAQRLPAVLVTGGTGFVGSSLGSALGADFHVSTASRRGSAHAVGDIGPATDWRRALDGVDVVIHAAGPAHGKFPSDELRRAIVDASAALARQAANAGVKRFIYVSSIRASVSKTTQGPVDEDAPPHPDDAYGQAKREAELAILAETSLRPIALRPPLVIGANPKANLAQFLRLLDTPWPLPFAGIRNKRNIVSLASLAEAVRCIARATDNPATGVFHVADQPSVSTGEMAALLREGLKRPPRLFAPPGFELVAPKPLVQSLEVDDARLRKTFGYHGQNAREALIACGAAWAAR